MKRTVLLLMLVAAMLLACTGVVLAQSSTDKKAPVQEEEQDTIQGQYIVVLKDNVGKAKDVADKHANKDKFTAKHVYEHALKGYSAKLSDAQLAEVQSEPEVEFISRDRKIQAFAQKTDSKQSSSSKEGASAQSFVPITSGDSAPTGVKRISATNGTDAAQASDVNVAVIDTGIDLTHPDLNAQSGTNVLARDRLRRTTTVTAPTSRAPSERRMTAAAWSASHQERSFMGPRCSTLKARGLGPKSSAASTG